jgi:DNA-binding CsgD family transcriptional regulator
MSATQSGSHPPHPGAGAGPVGRDPELARLAAFVDRAAAGGAALLVLGDPGVGKTLLLDAAAAVAAGRGHRVLRAGGVQFEAEVSFAGLNQALLPLVAEFARLGAPHRHALNAALGFGEADTSPERLLVSTATVALLRLAAEAAPLLVLVDDLQWLDRASAGVLGFVARRLAGSRVGFLGAARVQEDGFFDHSGLPEYELGPLDDESARLLVAGRFPGLAPRVRDRVLAEAAGNPLALLELPAGLATMRELPSVLPLGRRLEGLFASRVSLLPDETRLLLLLTALDGTGDLRVLRSVRAGDDRLDDLAPAEQARLVSIDAHSHQLVFRHPLIRSAVVGLSTQEERRSAHRALAELLADQPDRRAWHLAEATLEPDESVAALLEAAGYRMLRRGDAVGAVTALTRASGLSPAGAARGRRLAEAAFIGADVTGDLRNVTALLADARRADPQLRSSLRSAVAAAYALTNGDGDIVTAHTLLVGAIEARAEPYDADDPALISGLQTLLYVCLWAGRDDLWPPFYRVLARLRGESPEARDLRLAVLTRADPVRTATEPVLAQLDAAVASLADEADPVRTDRIIRAAVYVDRTSDCRATLLRVIENGRGGGAVTAAISAMMSLCIDDFGAGRWDETVERAEEGIALCESHGYGLNAWAFRRSIAVVAAGRGDLERTRALTDEMSRWALPRRVHTVEVYAHHVRELAALGAGDYEAAYRELTAISPPGVLPSHVSYALWVVLDLVEAAKRAGHHDEAAAHVAAMRAANIAAISPRFELMATGAAAIAAADDRAGRLFEEALAVPGRDLWPFELARVRLAYGEQLRRARALTESRGHLGAALELFVRLGARPWADRAAAELRASGVSRPRAEERDRDALSPQEREIAMLAATGLSNKQIGQRLYLSHRTVGAHLYRIYPKLGITSRAALRDALRSLPEEPPPPG